MTPSWRENLKWAIGPAWTTRLRCIANRKALPRWGNLRRTEPFSAYFGFERGTPVDRYYLERFLEEHRHQITGRVLEIQSTGYTSKYGHHLVTSDSVDINADCHPTYLCDLACSETIPSAYYDCFLLPNTIQHFRRLESCLHHVFRVVRPGGVILASVAGLMPLIPDGPDYWRCSAVGVRELTRRVWPDADVQIQSHGNCLTAVAAIMGLSVEELTPEEFEVNDSRYPVLTTLFCGKREA